MLNDIVIHLKSDCLVVVAVSTGEKNGKKTKKVRRERRENLLGVKEFYIKNRDARVVSLNQANGFFTYKNENLVKSRDIVEKAKDNATAVIYM